MNRFEEIRPSAGKVVLHCVIALVLGLLQPLAVMFQVVLTRPGISPAMLLGSSGSLPVGGATLAQMLTTVSQTMLPVPGFSLAMIMAAMMYGSAGAAPVVVLSIASAASLLLIYGAAGAAAMAMWLIPALVIIAGMRRREPFFRQLARGVIAAAAATAAAAAAIVLIYGSDVIGITLNWARTWFEKQKDVLWQLFEPMYQGATFGQFVESYYVTFNALELYYGYYLLSNLFAGAVVSAAAAVLWGNWRIARRGGATAESYRRLGQWYLPESTTWGMLLMLAAGFILGMTKLPGAQTAWAVIAGVCQMAFLIQCTAALERRMKKGGSGSNVRTLLILMLTILSYAWGMTGFLAVIGASSALFGSKGAAKRLIDKMNDKTDGKGR